MFKKNKNSTLKYVLNFKLSTIQREYKLPDSKYKQNKRMNKVWLDSDFYSATSSVKNTMKEHWGGHNIL